MALSSGLKATASCLRWGCMRCSLLATSRRRGLESTTSPRSLPVSSLTTLPALQGGIDPLWAASAELPLPVAAGRGSGVKHLAPDGVPGVVAAAHAHTAARRADAIVVERLRAGR